MLRRLAAWAISDVAKKQWVTTFKSKRQDCTGIEKKLGWCTYTFDRTNSPFTKAPWRYNLTQSQSPESRHLAEAKLNQHEPPLASTKREPTEQSGSGDRPLLLVRALSSRNSARVREGAEFVSYLTTSPPGNLALHRHRTNGIRLSHISFRRASRCWASGAVQENRTGTRGTLLGKLSTDSCTWRRRSRTSSCEQKIPGFLNCENEFDPSYGERQRGKAHFAREWWTDAAVARHKGFVFSWNPGRPSR